MTRLLAAGLLALAARRWPAGQRDRLLTEWLAELHVLAADGRRLAMLTFAVSLAASRPTTDSALIPIPARRTAIYLFAAPVAAAGSLIVALLAAGTALATVEGLLVGALGEPDGGSAWLKKDVAMPVTALAVLAACGFMVIQGRRWGRRSSLSGPAPLALAVTISLPLLPLFIGLTADWNALLAGVFVWVPGFGLTLHAAARLARSGRSRVAWLAGLGGSLVTIDLAVIAEFLPWGSHPELDYAAAPLWFPSMLVSSSFGLPHPTLDEYLNISAAVMGMPQLCLVLAAYSIAYVTTAASPASLPLKAMIVNLD